MRRPYLSGRDDKAERVALEMNGTLTDVADLTVGHYTDAANGTGCTVVLAPQGTVGGVDVRGAAPGTRETDLLRSENTVVGVNAIVLSGGSAYGLAAASGVMQFLEEQGVGHRVGGHIVPIVPSAIIFDLGVGNGMVRPTHAHGYAAARDADALPVLQGNVGAGAGATVGKALGRERAMKGGLGSASLHMGDGVVIAALAIVNAIGGVHDPDSGELLAGPRGEDGEPLESTAIYAAHDYGSRLVEKPPLPLGNTTIGVIATNVRLTKTQANRLATVAHDGLALAIRPTHTLHDGDAMFALATGGVDAPDEFPRLCALAPAVTARAIVAAIAHATDAHGFPAARRRPADG